MKINLSAKIGSQLQQKKGLLDMVEKSKMQNKLGMIENKEQNLENINKIASNLQAQEDQMKIIRDKVKEMGNTISESISVEKLQSIENKEKEKELERQNKEQEMTEFINGVKTEKKAKKIEVSNASSELDRQQQMLESSKSELENLSQSNARTLQKMDSDFQSSLAEKEAMLQSLMKALNDLKEKTKMEKKKYDEIEEKDDELDNEREKASAELERLDQELDILDDDYEDLDLLIEMLQSQANDFENQKRTIQNEQKKYQSQVDDLKMETGELENQVFNLQKESERLSAIPCNLDELQKQVQDQMDTEKTLFEANLKLVESLKDVQGQKSSSDKMQSEMQQRILILTEQNFLERKGRYVEKMIRGFEDKLRDKKLSFTELQRNIMRLKELIHNESQSENKTTYGLDELKEKVDKLDLDYQQLEREKDSLRDKKKFAESGIVGKDVTELSMEAISKCQHQLKDVEKEIDSLLQKENDVLNVERLKKNFTDIERQVGADFFKKDKALKDHQEKRMAQLQRKVEDLLARAKVIDEEVFPDVSKIADDDDEIEILRHKMEILKQIKRQGQDIISIEIEQEAQVKLAKIVFKRDDTYDLIDQYQLLQDIELDMNGIEKDVSQLTKRLQDFELGLKQFEIDLKIDFYEDSCEEVQTQQKRIQLINDQVQQLNEGINAIQEAIKQAQSGINITGENQEDIVQLQQILEKLKDERNKLEKGKKDLMKDGNILEGDLKLVNIEKITPTSLEQFDGEISKLKEATNIQEKQVNQALQEMKKLKEEAQALAFKKKADKRQQCKQKLKKIADNSDELDRMLNEIGSIYEMINQDAKYLKDTSPTKQRASLNSMRSSLAMDGDLDTGDKHHKNRASMVFGQDGNDLEKIQDVQKLFSELQKQNNAYQQSMQSNDQIKKVLQQYEDKFDNLPLEKSKLVDYENFVDQIQNEIEEEATQKREEAKQLLENELKKIKDDVEHIIEKFKIKKNLLTDCKNEEKEKVADVQKLSSLANGFKLRVGQMERELLNQQSMNFKTNEEKKELGQQLLKDVLDLKEKAQNKADEIEKQQKYLDEITADLGTLSDKIVTIDQLKFTYKQLIEMKKLQTMKDEMKLLQDQIQQKEQQVESYIKDILGGSLYECERKLKEADAMIDKMQKKIIEINNGMNDFDIDVKKGMQINAGDEDINKEGKRLGDENFNDRKNLKDVEDQKNLIRKVLQKIRGQLNEQNENKSRGSTPLGKSEGGKVRKVSTNQINAQLVDELIEEIETCMKKGESQSQDLTKLDQNLEQRKVDWSNIMFKSGSKDALVEDIEKSLKDNLANIEQLEDKLKDIEKITKGFTDIYKEMKDNPDYQQRQSYVTKNIELNNEAIKQMQQLQKEKKAVQDKLTAFKAKRDQGLKNIKIEDLQQLAKDCEETSEKVGSLCKEGEQLFKELQKRRQKLGDADILDNFKNRVEELNEADNKLKELEKENIDLGKIIQESAKVNPQGAKEGQNLFQQQQKDIEAQNKSKEDIQRKLIELREKIKQKDLNRDDPSSFVHLVVELKNLYFQISQLDVNLNKISMNNNHLKNKFGGVDIEKKFEQLKVNSVDQKKKLQELSEDLEVLKELSGEFDGYTSDNQEEDFIERLIVELKELGTKHIKASENAETLEDQVQSAMKQLERQKGNLGAKEIEERATLLTNIEQLSITNKKLVDEISNKVAKNKKVFMAMQSKDKFRRRWQEVLELNKRLELFENQLNEVEAEMQIEVNKIKIGTQEGENLMKIFEGLFKEIETIKDDYKNVNQSLVQVQQDVNDWQQSKQHQFELLKGNIGIKKRVLNILNHVKQVRQQFAQVKQQYEINKPKKVSNYKAAKGDEVDQLLANFLNNNVCPVPIKRMGNGYYMFGTKKIYAKVINSKLVIRVGGGYMGIEEFMFYYGAQELNKMIAYENIEDKDELDLEAALDPGMNPGDLMKQGSESNAAIIGIQQMKRRLSPRQQSPRQGSPNAQAQLKRSAQGIASPRNNVQVILRTESGRPGVGGRKSPAGSFLQQNSLRKQQ